MKSLSIWIIVFFTAGCLQSHAALIVQPYLQNPTENGMDVLWWTDDSSSDSRVEYGKNFKSHRLVTPVFIPLAGRYLNHATIRGLQPGTRYAYRVVSGSSVSPEYSLTTSPSPGQATQRPIHIGVLGDGRTDTADIRRRHREIAHLARSRGAGLLFEVGDMVYGGTQEHWDYLLQRVLTTSHEENPNRPTASHVPYMMVVGNHEIFGGQGAYASGGLADTMPRYQAHVSTPANSSSDPRWRERYYRLKYGPITVIVLDANNTSDDTIDNHSLIPDGYSPDWQPGSEQYNWMIRELERAQLDSAFTIVMSHPSSYSRGVHGTNDNPTTDYQTGYELRVLDPIFRKYGVDAVIQGHDHMVERCVTGPKRWWNQPGAFNREHPAYLAWVNDPSHLNYITMGNSGEDSRPAHPGWKTWMDIHNDEPEAPAGTYYTDYFYDWAEHVQMSSYLDIQCVQTVKKAETLWQTTFTVVRRDDATGKISEFDRFVLTRPNPHSPAQKQPQ